MEHPLSDVRNVWIWLTYIKYRRPESGVEFRNRPLTPTVALALTIIQEHHRETRTTKLDVAAAAPQASPSDVNEYQVASNLGSSRSNCDYVSC